jgi:hypothetical protein
MTQAYLHSHIAWNDGPKYWSSSFCFGDTEFKGFYRRISGNGEMSQQDIYQLLLGMDKFLEWESLEGTPYNRIGNIKEYELQPLSVRRDPAVEDGMYNYVVDHLDSFQYSTEIRNGESKIVVTSSLEEVMKEFLVLKGMDRTYVVRTSNGQPVTVNTSGSSRSNEYKGKNSAVKFKDRQLPIKIDYGVVDTKNLDTLHPLRVLPSLYEAVKVKLQDEFENYLNEKEK